MAFCGNMIELVEKHKVLDEKENFVQWKEIKDKSRHASGYLRVFTLSSPAV